MFCYFHIDKYIPIVTQYNNNFANKMPLLVFIFVVLLGRYAEPAKIVGLRGLKESLEPSSRIIGGGPAYWPFFRYMSAIWLSTPNGRYFCSGTIVNHQWILTAGQCVDGATTFTIQIGSSLLNDPEATVLSASEYVIHPEYDILTLHHDVGLIELRLPIQFNDQIAPIDLLPTYDIITTDIWLMTGGWGQTSDADPSTPDELQSIEVTSLINEECQAIYSDQIKDEMICTVGQFNEGICFGDIGTALVRVWRDGQRMIVGIGSFVSSNGCESLDPSGYTRVFLYTDWIEGYTNSTKMIK